VFPLRNQILSPSGDHLGEKKTGLYETTYDLHVFYATSKDILVVATTSALICDSIRNKIAPNSKLLSPDRLLLIWPCDHLLIQNFPTFPTVPSLFTAFQNTMAKAYWFVALLTEEHHIGNMERGFLLDNPSPSLLTMGPRVPFNEIDLFNDHSLFLG
jgi:hypothetical protein